MYTLLQKMTADQYITQVVNAKTHNYLYLASHVQPVITVINGWAGNFLRETKLSGSNAKNTAVAGSTDVDIFISLKQNTLDDSDKKTLKELYNSLATHMENNGYSVRRQNVSIGIKHGIWDVDLVPAVHQGGLLVNDHSIYKRKQDTWAKTNIDTHINQVKNSGRTFDIRAVKIWRNVNNLDFPSFYLELAVIEALRGRPLNDPSGNLNRIFEFLANDLPTKVFYDPANTNNRISDDLTTSEKNIIANKAYQHRYNTTFWKNIIW